MKCEDCRTCEYHKEKWKKTVENGQPLMYVEKIYCPFKECKQNIKKESVR